MNIQETAEGAAAAALSSLVKCLQERKSFVLEAGAGAGKTYSLVHALNYLIEHHGDDLVRHRRQVACITYTNAATAEIGSRIDRHPAVWISTSHSFCWGLLQRFQADLRAELEKLPKWPERLEESDGLRGRRVDYDLGFPSARAPDHVSLAHSDVLMLMVAFLDKAKFRALMTDRFPVILIDEYQDTNAALVEALTRHFVRSETRGPLLGFFGDHWQKIYGDGCGSVDDPGLARIEKLANFRSVPAVVDVLNRLRPELAQAPSTDASGSARAFHTNSWPGTRRDGAHWKGDLPANVAHERVAQLMGGLRQEGWDFHSGDTKVLMLTHNVLAGEQGYTDLLGAFGNNDMVVKKDDPYIAFFADVVEPAAAAYASRHYGDMIDALGGHRPVLRSSQEKKHWARDMDALLELRLSGKVGALLDHLAQCGRPRLATAVEWREKERKRLREDEEAERPQWFASAEALRVVPYRQVTAVVNFINEATPFATKHGVKGLEFENVLVVVGKGWNQYNFGNMLECTGSTLPANKLAAFERARNLFYVACSRPRTNLAVLFTEHLSDGALTTLTRLFGTDNVTDFEGTHLVSD